MATKPALRTVDRWDKILDALESILAGPRWLRLMTALLACVLAIVGGTVTAGELVDRLSTIINRKDVASGTANPGVHVPTLDDPGSKHLVEQEIADLKHAEKHHELNDLIERHKFIDTAEDGELTVEAYKSDKCIWIHRVDYKNHLELKKWIHPTLSGVSPPKNAQKQDLVPRISDEMKLAGFVLPPAATLAKLAGVPPSSAFAPVQGGRCLDPHPGQFSYWWGQANGCWVPFNRQFQDGCHHIQWYNGCTSIWDSRILWDRCVH
jgi:hypothetical protein